MTEIEKTFKEISLNEVASYSPWPARILGIEKWKFGEDERTSEHILKEYGEKWGYLLNEFKKTNFENLESLVEFVFEKYFSKDAVFHINERLFVSKADKFFWDFIYRRIVNLLNSFMTSDDTIVELGSGWGRNIFRFYLYGLFKKAVGGEYTEEGVLLGNAIAQKYSLPVNFEHFDYNNPGTDFYHHLNGAIVFTHNSVEQINFLKKETISSIIENKPKFVIHFEPIYEYRTSQTILHYLWKRYTEINDYNRNLLTILKEFEGKGIITIMTEDVHALGLNAMNPGSFIVWKVN